MGLADNLIDDYQDEIARLKEQNASLKDEIKRLIQIIERIKINVIITY